MGFIPIFLTLGGACLLFFLTVRTTLQRKLNLQREISSKLGINHPELDIFLGEIADPELIYKKWREVHADKKIPKNTLEQIKALKVNKLQYNQLIKKAPYNWVAKISGYSTI
ncbi:hypothetical protein JYB62_07200 [Algoriphagus lutimaris]|uniref:hypothetical protein n=1 Tax=Algoriphagus lutimaris TaxID=613197 RepID=UPI00196AB6A8|nr:hypothetical protein [Algoriphagus lutimaris]MBN3519786.1 hypothetical protein [Algoriphagus lutimaris]